jgi:hypothetical protein
MNETGDARSAPAAALDRSALPSPYIQWGPIFGGGLVAASVFFVLITFATAIGLAVSSVSPTWRDTSVGLVVLSGAWVVLTAVGSFALGGYIAGPSNLADKSRRSPFSRWPSWVGGVGPCCNYRSRSHIGKRCSD